jgi:hypothetical protein
MHLIPQPLLLAKEKGSQNFFLFPSPLQGEGLGVRFLKLPHNISNAYKHYGN